MWDVSKIFGYELRRLVASRLFAGLLVVIAWYSWQLLGGTIILGVANTAPFSPWSFGYYLSRLLPLLSAALLAFLWNQCSGKARGIEVLVDAAPVRPGCYLMVKCGAVAAAWMFLALLVMWMGIAFLVALFGRHVSVISLMLPAAVALLPPLVFQAGLGLLLGRLRPALLFVPFLLALGLSALPLPMALDLFGASVFSGYPSMLDTLDPAFSLPIAVVATRIAFLLAGVAGLAAALHLEIKSLP